MGRLNVRLDAQELREKFFSYQGRLNRKPFIMRLLGVIVVSTIVDSRWPSSTSSSPSCSRSSSA